MLPYMSCHAWPLVSAAETSVTLVCTDVEGSTEMWEWDNKVTMEAINLHDRCMRKHLAKFGGYEVATEGDAFLFAFHTPGSAVAYTAATQQVGVCMPVCTVLCIHISR